MPAYYPFLTLVSIVVFALLGRHLAKARNRNGLAWGIGGAVLPPVLAVLWFLRPLTAEEAELDAPEV